MATRRPSRKKRSARSAPTALAAAARLYRTRVLSLLDVGAGDPGANPDNPDFEKRFLAEGDSWFSFGAVPRSANLLQQMHLPVASVMLTLAQPGDTIRHMSEIAGNPLLRDYLTRPQFASNWDSILLSGGGNDLIDNVDTIIVGGAGLDPANYIDDAQLRGVLDAVARGYSAIVALRDGPGSASRGKPIVTHTYDYPTPNNAPATFFGAPAQGPWFWTRFEAIGLADRPLRAAITDYVLDRLAETLLGLQNRLPGFHVVDTRGTLVRAAPDVTHNSNDWLNEIHPNSGGYRKIADKVSALL